MADKIIDLGEEREKRIGPDSEFIRKDDFGRTLYSFLLSYEMGDSRWSTDIWAYDFADAEARVAAMRESLKLDGQAYSCVPV